MSDDISKIYLCLTMWFFIILTLIFSLNGILIATIFYGLLSILTCLCFAWSILTKDTQIREGVA